MTRCEKCGYETARKIGEIFLCSICSKFAPFSHTALKKYVKEKLNWQDLESFRKYAKKNIEGMQKKAKQGRVVSRAPFGYRILNKRLVIDEEKSLIVKEIFHTFLTKNVSLSQLAKKYDVSVNGLKKILRNFTYIGKIKFKGEIMQGKHKEIITPELFNKVQSKLESLGIS